jgi:hypothetical protein
MSAIERFIVIESALGLRRSVVLFVTLWMTWRSFQWATEYAYVLIKADNNTLVAAAAMIAAVTAPVTYLQKVVFDAYISSKGDPPPKA